MTGGPIPAPPSSFPPAGTERPPERLARALLFVPVAGVALGDRSVGVSWLHFSDVALGLFLALSFPTLWRAGRRAWPAWARSVPLLFAAALLSGVVPLLLGSTSFDPASFLRSFARLVFCVSGGVAVGAWLDLTGGTALRPVVGDAFALSGMVGVVLYGAVLSGVPLPDSIVCGQDQPDCPAYYSEREWFGEGGPRTPSAQAFLRAQGLSSEPSRFGYLHAMALGFLLFRRPGGTKPGLREAVVALAALVSFALSAYALLALFAVLLAGRFLSGTAALSWTRAAAGGALVCLLVTVPPTGPTLRRSIGARVARIARGGKDLSAVLRVAGSWELAARIAAPQPVSGAGLGQFDIRARSLVARGEFWAAPLLLGAGQPWNGLAYFLGATGMLGLAAFVLLAARALRPQPELGLFFLAGLFADGTVLGPALWVFLALFSHPPEDGAEPAVRAGANA